MHVHMITPEITRNFWERLLTISNRSPQNTSLTKGLLPLYHPRVPGILCTIKNANASLKYKLPRNRVYLSSSFFNRGAELKLGHLFFTAVKAQVENALYKCCFDVMAEYSSTDSAIWRSIWWRGPSLTAVLAMESSVQESAVTAQLAPPPTGHHGENTPGCTAFLP